MFEQHSKEAIGNLLLNIPMGFHKYILKRNDWFIGLSFKNQNSFGGTPTYFGLSRLHISLQPATLADSQFADLRTYFNHFEETVHIRNEVKRCLENGESLEFVYFIEIIIIIIFIDMIRIWFKAVSHYLLLQFFYSKIYLIVVSLWVKYLNFMHSSPPMTQNRYKSSKELKEASLHLYGPWILRKNGRSLKFFESKKRILM